MLLIDKDKGQKWIMEQPIAFWRPEALFSSNFNISSKVSCAPSTVMLMANVGNQEFLRPDLTA